MEHVIENCECEGKLCKKCNTIKCLGYMASYNAEGIQGYRFCCRDCYYFKYRGIVRKAAQTHPEDMSHVDHISENCTCKGWICEQCKVAKCIAHMGSYKKVVRCKECKKKNQAYSKHTWRKNNPDKDKKLKVKYEKREIVKEYRRKKAKEWYLKHPDKVKERTKMRAPLTKETRRKYMTKEVRRKYNATRRAHKLNVEGSYTVQEWNGLKAKYNHTCLCCERKEPDIKLTADHVIPLTKRGSNYISNIQPLCQSCNSSKGTKIIDYRPRSNVS